MSHILASRQILKREGRGHGAFHRLTLGVLGSNIHDKDTAAESGFVARSSLCPELQMSGTVSVLPQVHAMLPMLVSPLPVCSPKSVSRCRL